MKKIFITLLIITVFNLYLPKLTFAGQNYTFAKSGITKNEPEFVATPEVTIVTPSSPSKFPWKLVLALLAVAGGALAIGGGGGSSGGDDGGNGGSGGGSGTIDVNW